MNSLDPRNRVVVFRLSQEEYQALKTACSVRGGRNLSEFTRSELLAMIQSESIGHMVQKRLTQVEQTLTDLSAVLVSLHNRLDGASFVVLDGHRNDEHRNRAESGQ
jgi:hypothetical protein